MAVGQLDDAFFPALEDYSSRWGVPPSWALLALYLESRFNTTAHNPGSGFWGLSQLNTADVRRLAGVSPDVYLQMPASEQFLRAIGPWYTEALSGKPCGHSPIQPASPGVFYAFNLAPCAVKDGAPTNTLYSSPSKEYTANKGLDANGDGAITISDLDAFMYKLSTGAEKQPYLTALGRLSDSTPPYNGAPFDPTVVDVRRIALLAGSGVALGVAGALAYAEWKHHRHPSRRNPIREKPLLLAGGAVVAATATAGAILFFTRQARSQPPLPGFTYFPIVDSPGAKIHFTDDFGQARVGHSHQGNDLFATEGTTVVSPADGQLTYTADGIPGPPGSPPPLSFRLKGDDGTVYWATHFKTLEGSVGDSKRVVAGEAIATVGRGGNAAGTPPHVHFEVHPKGGAAVDPFPYLIKLPRLVEAVAAARLLPPHV